MAEFYNFTKMSKTQMTKLHRLVEKRPATIIVHPYWWEKNPALEAFLTKSKTERLMVIFEEGEKIMPTIKRLNKVAGNTKTKFLVVPTEKEQGTPACGWNKFFRKFDLLGAKKVIIGGDNFDTISKKQIVEEIKEYKKAGYSGKKLSVHRTMLRAAKSKYVRTKKYHNLEECAGGTASKFMARRKGPKVRITKKFTVD